MATHNTQYKTVVVLWFAGVWFLRQRFPWWIQTRSENPIVLYSQTFKIQSKKPN